MGVLKRIKSRLFQHRNIEEELTQYIKNQYLGKYVQVDVAMDWRGFDWSTYRGILIDYEAGFPYHVRLDSVEGIILGELCNIKEVEKGSPWPEMLDPMFENGDYTLSGMEEWTHRS